PAHGPVSLDRLHQISEILSKAASQSDGGNLGYAMADAVKVIDDLLEVRKAEPVSDRDELTLDYLQGHKDGLEWAAQLTEANHPQTGDWLYDDPIELAKAIRKGPDMPEDDGNSPATPDGLVGCGENCWSCGKYFTYEQHSECDGYCPHCDSPVDLDDEEDEQSKAVPAKPTEDMISNAWRESLGKCDHETIRRMYVAMLAAAPKQEVKS
ncbi:hypothetical protein ACHH1V_11500, partial [Citrobacter freundii complex sp. 2024EL-00236]